MGDQDETEARKLGKILSQSGGQLQQCNRSWPATKQWTKPIAKRSNMLAQLTKCLIPVCPTGFSDSDREEWLASQIEALQSLGVTDEVIRDGCMAVRTDGAYDHPSKFMAAFRRYLGDWKNPKATQSYEPVQVFELIEPPIVTIPDDEIRAMSPTMRVMGLTKGWITQDQIDRVGESYD